MKVSGFLNIFLILTLSLFIFSCGGSRKNVEDDLFDTGSYNQPSQEESKGEDSEIQDLEALLGISRDDTKETKTEDNQQQESASAEDSDGEILTLLGADEGKGKKTDNFETLPEPAGDARLSKVNKENETLRRQLKEKNNTIQALQQEVSTLSRQLDERPAAQASSYSAGASSSYQSFSTGTASVTTYEDYKSQYDQALAMFNDRNYEGALRQFEQLIAADTKNNLSDNVQYWIGESRYMMKRYQEALVDFEKVFTFPKSNKNDYAQYKIAVCYLRLGNRERARVELERFMDNYPNSPIRSKAQDLLNRI